MKCGYTSVYRTAGTPDALTCPTQLLAKNTEEDRFPECNGKPQVDSTRGSAPRSDRNCKRHGTERMDAGCNPPGVARRLGQRSISRGDSWDSLAPGKRVATAGRRPETRAGGVRQTTRRN